jgi:hypothetical protein
LTNTFYGAAFQMSGSAHAGNNILIAGAASGGGKVVNDMWGDAAQMGTAKGGHDTFVFNDNNVTGQTVGTNNTIEDFNQTQHDIIALFGIAGVTGFCSLTFDTTIDPGSTVIHAGNDQITLQNFTGKLTSHDFNFAKT